MTTSPPARETIGYIGRQPDDEIPLSVRLEMRADKCGHCGSKVLVHAAGLRLAIQMYDQCDVALKILCSECGKIALAETGPPLPTPLPPGWKKHFADHRAN